MADTIIGAGDPQAVKRWSNQLMRETFGKMAIRGLIGRSVNSPIVMLTDLDKQAGDNIKYDLRKQDRSTGVSGDTPLSGAFYNAAADDQGGESPMVFWQDELNINQKRNAHVFGAMTQQRTVHDLRAEARDSMSEWYAWGIESGFMAHFSGTTGDGNESSEPFLFETETGTPQTGADVLGNTLEAIDANHLIDGTAASFTMGLVEAAVARAKTINPRVAPARIDGDNCYILLLHPYAARNLRTELDADGNSAAWIDSMRRAAVRGEANPIWTGALGKYNNVILAENEFVTRNVATNQNNNVFLGACGGAIAFGNAWNRLSRVRANGGKGSFWSYIENEDDYGNKTGFGTGSVLGMKRNKFNGEAFGALVVASQDLAS